MCLCIYLHIYTRKLNICGCIFTYMYTKFTDGCTPSLHVCVYVLTYMYAKSTCVCAYIYMYIHVRINACIYICVCTCVYGYIYVCIYVCERTLWVHIDAMCVYQYMYTYLGLYVCVYVCMSIHICMKRRRVCIQSVCIQIQAYMSVFLSCLHVFFVYVCVGMYIYACIHEKHHGCIEIHCVRIGIHAYVSVFVRVCMYTHVYIYI